MEALFSPIPLITAFFIALVVCSLAVVCWRTQSLHFLLRRFWLLVHGSKDIPDPVIQAFSEEQTSLYAFRLFSGTQVKSLEQAHQLLVWSKEYQIPISSISACGDFFDYTQRIVLTEKLPGKAHRTALFVWLITLIITIAGSIFIAIYAPGALTLKATDRWVNFTENKASIIFAPPFKENALDYGDCKSKKPNHLESTKFSDEEIKIICNLFDNSEWKKYINHIKIKQRKDIFIISAIATFCLLLNLISLNKYASARNLSKTIKNKNI